MITVIIIVITIFSWLPALESTRWLHNLSYLLSAALSVVENIHCQGRPVLVHCSDGWDRTTQIVSLAKLCLDPYYRTMKVSLIRIFLMLLFNLVLDYGSFQIFFYRGLNVW